MKKGIDANVDLTRYVACLKQHGYNFVGRYYNVMNHAKNLTLAEAKILSREGISIVAVWENGNPTKADYFSHAKGVYDGTAAYHYAKEEIGQPAHTPIYFGVDFDAQAADLPLLSAYFKGIEAAFNTISHNNPGYLIGGYGSGLVCSTLLAENLAKYTWLAQSGGWSGSKTFKHYNIKQGLQIPVCGFTGDPDESPNGNEGSFTVPH